MLRLVTSPMRLSSLILLLFLSLPFGNGLLSRSMAEEKKDKPVVVSLESVHATFEQEKLRKVDVGNISLEATALNEVRKLARAFGPTNLFLVRGSDLGAAVRATSLTYRFEGGPDTLFRATSSRKEPQIWIVAYFGANQSSPPIWKLNSIERNGQNIRVSSSRLKPRGGTADVSPYILWAPLGELEAGTYRLELYDAEKKEVVLMRSTEIEK